MKLLTESEVAERLRCSPYTVARLRKRGRLPYIPGRPVLIDEADLLAYLECMKCRPQTSDKQTTAPGTSTGPKADEPSAEQLARKIFLKRRLSSVTGS